MSSKRDHLRGGRYAERAPWYALLWVALVVGAMLADIAAAFR